MSLKKPTGKAKRWAVGLGVLVLMLGAYTFFFRQKEVFEVRSEAESKIGFSKQQISELFGRPDSEYQEINIRDGERDYTDVWEFEGRGTFYFEKGKVIRQGR